MSLLEDNHEYSYSQLSSFSECPFGYYLKYIEHVQELSNGFAEQGTLIHDILDEWAKKLITKEQMATEYINRYEDSVQTSFPAFLVSKGYAEKTYEAGLEFFRNFNEFDGYTVVSAEEKIKMPIKLSDGSARPFIAIIDLVLRNDFTGGLVVMDHKSKSWSTFRKERDNMYKQQYIYSYFIHEKYGEWPETLAFNLFKENGKIDEMMFSMDTYNETMQWVTDTINKIESADILDFMECKEVKPSKKTGKLVPDMMCSAICGVRGQCFNSIER